MDKAKFWVALIGGAATSAMAVFGANSTIGKVATVALAGATAAGVWRIPNAPAVDAAPEKTLWRGTPEELN